MCVNDNVVTPSDIVQTAMISGFCTLSINYNSAARVTIFLKMSQLGEKLTIFKFTRISDLLGEKSHQAYDHLRNFDRHLSDRY